MGREGLQVGSDSRPGTRIKTRDGERDRNRGGAGLFLHLGAPEIFVFHRFRLAAKHKPGVRKCMLLLR